MPLGLASGTVRIVAYDPAWPALFIAESARIRDTLGVSLPISLEHMGSTAIPGCAAKPVLDILGGYPAGSDVRQYVEALVAAGYVHRGEQGIPGREFFRRGDPRSFHLHLAVEQGQFWREHLAFRDALRSRNDLRDAYVALKLELARRFPADRESYIEGKTAFVRDVVARNG
jgi:GrpB-like predicted nucleotidyltransferase (UPF0157 family)